MHVWGEYLAALHQVDTVNGNLDLSLQNRVELVAHRPETRISSTDTRGKRGKRTENRRRVLIMLARVLIILPRVLIILTRALIIVARVQRIVEGY
jgi:hypothetical protein